MRRFAPFFLLALAGCPDDNVTTEGGGGSGAGGGGGADGGADPGGGGAGGGPLSCDEPKSAVIGPDGGELSHCGATLVFPEGALAEDEEITISVEAAPPEAPFERELAAPVFVMTPEFPELALPVSLTLDHDAAGSRIYLARYDDAEQTYFGIESCETTETTIQQFVGALGTWTVLRDVNDYPDSTQGLGDGTIDATFLDTETNFDLDSQGSYGIYQSSESGDRVVTLIAWNEIEGGIQQLRLDFNVDATGTDGQLVQATWTDTVTSMGYSFIDGLVGSGGTFTVTETEDGRFQGEVTANMSGGNPPTEEPLSATFDVAVEKYAFPPEQSCPGGEGG